MVRKPLGQSDRHPYADIFRQTMTLLLCFNDPYKIWISTEPLEECLDLLPTRLIQFGSILLTTTTTPLSRKLPRLSSIRPRPAWSLITEDSPPSPIFEQPCRPKTLFRPFSLLQPSEGSHPLNCRSETMSTLDKWSKKFSAFSMSRGHSCLII